MAAAVRRGAVRPAARRRRRTGRRGAVIADGDEVAVVAREELPATIAFWRGHGFVETAAGRRTSSCAARSRTPTRHPTPTPCATSAGWSAELVRAGDLVVLSGELGAGKTTFTQGLGAGLGVRGDITSPTFVIARVHPSLGAGPALVHVDAYRLGGIDELDDLDLDASLDEAVTVVEWGTGVAEALADSRLEVRIARSSGPSRDGELDPRTVTSSRSARAGSACSWLAVLGELGGTGVVAVAAVGHVATEPTKTLPGLAARAGTESFTPGGMPGPPTWFVLVKPRETRYGSVQPR